MDEIIKDIQRDLQDFLKPDGYFAWQTLLLLSLFSLLVASALNSITGHTEAWVSVISNLSWIFFTSAVWWGLSKNDPIKVGDFSLSPWITGAVLCVFLFRPFTEFRFRLALSLWPVLSTGIMALPYFVNWELKTITPKKPKQKEILMTILVNLLLTSWILFYFRVQDWIRDYPTLLYRGVDNSEFVVDFGDRQGVSQGARLLAAMTESVNDELDGLPWYQTERWLYTRQEKLSEILNNSLRTLESPKEEIFWQVTSPDLRPLEDGYFLDLYAQWVGPTSEYGSELIASQTCRIVPIDRPRPVSPSAETTTEVDPDAPVPTSRRTQVICDDEPTERLVTSDGQASLPAVAE